MCKKVELYLNLSKKLFNFAVLTVPIPVIIIYFAHFQQTKSLTNKL